MTKVRRQKKKKRFNTNINRKRLRNKLSNPGNVDNPLLKKIWDTSKSANINLRKIGLSYDANKTLKIKSFKDTERESAMKLAQENGFIVTKEEKAKPSIPKKQVLQELIEDAKAPREKKLRLPRDQAEQITYFMDKYGSDYKAMERDPKNYWQHTWRQFRVKIKKFMKAPKLYAEYLNKRGLLDQDSDDESELQKEAEALEMDSD